MEAAMLGAGSMQLNEQVFARRYNESLVHQAVCAYLAGTRYGTKAQRNRSRTAGGGAKPWRQKGMGRARAGTIRSPLWRGGGRAFAALPRDFSQKINRQMYRSALSSILSELYRRQQLVLIENILLESHKTKDLVAKLKEWSFDSVLLVDAEVNYRLVLASRNIPKVGLLRAVDLNPVNLLHFEKILMTRAAVEKIEAWLS